MLKVLDELDELNCLHPGKPGQEYISGDKPERGVTKTRVYAPVIYATLSVIPTEESKNYRFDGPKIDQLRSKLKTSGLAFEILPCADDPLDQHIVVKLTAYPYPHPRFDVMSDGTVVAERPWLENPGYRRVVEECLGILFPQTN